MAMACDESHEWTTRAASVLTPLELREVLPYSADTRGDEHAAPSQATLPASAASSAILLTVQDGSQFTCPVYLVALGSRTLRGVVEDLIEAEEAVPGAVDEEGEEDKVQPMPSHHIPSRSVNLAAGSDVPLPFLDKDTFTTVALYWEHFHGVGNQLGVPPPPSHSPAPQQQQRGEEDGKQRAEPSRLSTPLVFADLYALAEWEQVFVLQRLVKLPDLVGNRGMGPTDVRREGEGNRVDARDGAQRLVARYLCNGSWVDALGVPLGSVAAAAAGGHTSKRSAPTGVAQAPAPDHPSFAELVFPLSTRRAIFSRICVVLEAATRLGMAGLPELCAALLANMMVQLEEGEVGRMLSSSARALPAFTEERRRALLAKYPWADLARTGAAAALAGGVVPAARTAAAGVVDGDDVETVLAE